MVGLQRVQGKGGILVIFTSPDFAELVKKLEHGMRHVRGRKPLASQDVKTPMVFMFMLIPLPFGIGACDGLSRPRS